MFAIAGVASFLVSIIYVARPILASGPSSNRVLNYQLRLTDTSGVPVSDGTKNIKISFYDSLTAGTRLATDCGTTVTPVARKVAFQNGTASVLVGDTAADGTHNCADGSAPNALPASLFANPVLYLGITVGTDAEMTPRKRIVAQGYALNADLLDDLDTSSTGGSVAFIPATDGSGNLTLTKNLTVDTPSLVVDSTNHRVGVGINAPSTKMQVAGITTVTGDYVVDGDGSAFVDHGYYITAIAEGAPLVSAAGQGICTDSLAVPTKAYKDGNGDCVPGNGGTDAVLVGSSAGATVAVTSAWAFNDADTDCDGDGVGGDVGCTASDGIYQVGQDLYVDRFPQLSFNSANVGIGTDAPQANLHVVGTGVGNTFASYPAVVAIEAQGSNDWSLVFQTRDSGLDKIMGFYQEGYLPAPPYVDSNAGALYLASDNVLDSIQAWSEMDRRTAIGTFDTWSTLAVRSDADKAAIAGTTTANASTTIAGTGTLYYRDLGVGDRIALSSAPSVYATVTAIASDTSLTVDAPLGNGTSQTISRKSGIARFENASGGVVLGLNDQGRMGVGTVIPDSQLTVGQPALPIGSVSGGSDGIGVSKTLTAYGTAGQFQAVWDFPSSGFGITGTVSAAQTRDTNANNMTGVMTGAQGIAEHLGSGTATQIVGVQGSAYDRVGGVTTDAVGLWGNTVAQTATITNAVGVSGENGIFSSGTITNAYAVAARQSTLASGTITGNVGLQVDDFTVGTNKTDVLVGTRTIPAGNYSLYNASTYGSYFANNVGIGTSSPSELLTVAGNVKSTGRQAFGPSTSISSIARLNVADTVTTASGFYTATQSVLTANPAASGSNGWVGVTGTGTVPASNAANLSGDDLNGGQFTALYLGTGTAPSLEGVYASAINGNGGAANAVTGVLSNPVMNGGTVTYLNGFADLPQLQGGIGGTVTNRRGLYVSNPSIAPSSGAITNNYGIYVENQTSGANNFSLYAAGGKSYFAGNVGIGTSAPGQLLDVRGRAAIGAQNASLFWPSDLNTLLVSEQSTDTGTAHTGIQTDVEWNPSASSAAFTSYVSGKFSSATTSANSFNLTNGFIEGVIASAHHEGTGTVGNLIGAEALATNSTTGTVTTGTGLTATAQTIAVGSTLATAYGGRFRVQTFGGAITNGYALQARDGSVSGGGSVASKAGVDIEEITNATNNTDLLIGTTTIPGGNYAVYGASTRNSYLAGNVGLGETAPSFKLDVNGSTGIRVTGPSITALTLKSTDLTSDFMGIRWRDNANAALWSMGNDFNGTGNQDFWLYDNVNARTVLLADQSGTGYLSFGTTNGGFEYDNVAQQLHVFTNGTNKVFVNSTGEVGIGDSTPASLLTVGSGDRFNVNASGDVTSTFTALDGSTTTNGTGTNSTSLVVTSGTNFNDGNYVRVASAACVANPCYAKIVSGGGTTTLVISPALSWNNADAVTEVHVPEIGGVDTAQALANRYGRGYFIDGVVTGNGSTSYSDGKIESAGTLLVNATGNQPVTFGSGTVTVGGNLSVTGTLSSGGAAAFVNGGNSLGATATLGTNDNFPLSMETNGTTRMTLDTSGNLGLGTASPGGVIHIVTESASPMMYDRYGGAPPNIIFRRANGTIASPTAVTTDNQLFAVGGRGYGATGFSASGRAAMFGAAAESWTDTAQGAYLAFNTTATGTATASERMRIADSGNVGVGSSSPLSRMTVSGGDALVTNGNLVTAFGGQGNYENFVMYSDQFNNAAWTKTGVAVTADATTAPDGSSGADQIAGGAIATDGVKEVANNPYTMLVGFGTKTWTASVWLRANAGTPTVTLKLDANSVSESLTQSVTLSTSWQRYSITKTYTTGSGYPIFEIQTGTNTVFAWGAQLEYATAPGVYARTESVPVATSDSATVGRGFVGNGSFLVAGTQADAPTAGAGGRLMWAPNKQALRAGYVAGSNWDDSNIGQYSVAFGNDTKASGFYSFAGGNQSTATSTNAFAYGAVSNATGFASVALGSASTASGSVAVALGGNLSASGGSAMAFGSDLSASSTLSTAIGHYLNANVDHAMVIGHGVDNANRLTSNSTDSLMVGFNSTVPTLFVGTSRGTGTTGSVGIGSTTKLSALTVTPPADAANVGGTTTASATTAITGTGTSFLTTIGIGDRISLSSAPSTYATVTAIASDTSLTVDAALGNGTSQTINKKSSIFRLNDASGTARLVMNDQGFVGINDVNPANQLSVVNSVVNGAAPIKAEYVNGSTSTAQTAMTVLTTSTGDMTDGFGPMVEFKEQDNAGVENLVGQIGFTRDGADNTGKFRVFPTNGGVPLSSAFAVTWPDSIGSRVGVNTASPDSALHVQVANSVGTVPSQVHIQNTTNHPAADAGIWFDTANQDFNVGIDETSDSFVVANGTTVSGGTPKFVIDANGQIGFNSGTPGAAFDLIQAAASSGTPKLVSWTGGAHTGLTASTEAIDVDLALNRTVQFSTGALTTQRAVVVRQPTYAFAGASTLSIAGTMNVVGAPVAGTNATISNAAAFIAGDLAGETSAAGSAASMISLVPGITNGVGAATRRIGLWVTTPVGDVALGNQAATLTDFNALRIDDVTLNSTTNTRTVTNAASLYVRGAPTVGTNVSVTNGPYAVYVDSGDTRLDGNLALTTSGSLVDFASGTAGNTFKWQIPARAAGTCGSGVAEGVIIADSTGTQRGHVCIDAGTPLLKFYANQFNTTSTDIAELYSTRPEDGIEPGDVVELDPAGDLLVRKTTMKSAAGTFGVVSTAPGIVLSGIDEATGKGDTAHGVDVALKGRVPVKVNMENGPIAVGDYLTSSSSPGVAMKATGNGMVIGRALDAASENGTVRAFIEVGWWNGTQVLGATTTSGVGDLGALTVGVTDFDGHDLINVRSVHGIADAWFISEDGALAAKDVVTDAVTVRQSDAKTTLDRATIPSGKDYAQVHNPAITPDSRVFVTMKKNPGSQWWVDEVGEGFLVVKTAQPVVEDIPFDYWLVGAVDVRTPAPSPDAAAPQPAPDAASSIPADPAPTTGTAPDAAAPQPAPDAASPAQADPVPAQ